MRRPSATSSEPSVLLLNCHPDPRPERFCAALCEAFLEGAKAAQRDVAYIALGESPADSDHEPLAEKTLSALRALQSCDGLVAVLPLWFERPPPGTSRILELAACEQNFRPNRHVHLFVTMGLPAFTCRSRLGSVLHQFTENLELPGWQTTALTFIGGVDALTSEQRENWLADLRETGKAGFYAAERSAFRPRAIAI